MSQSQLQSPRLLEQMRAVIRARHYSLRTEETYVGWVKRFILFHGKRHPRDMGALEVQQFLSHLAREGHVAASTQSQALSAMSEKEMIMRRKAVQLVVMLALVVFTAPFAAHAQPATKTYRIGVVRGQTASAGGSENAAFTQRLRELGYTEDQNLVIEWRFADGHTERLPALVAELVRLQVDCLVVGGTEATRVAKQATSTIPIVMINASDDPVRLGLIDSLARPGGSITGVIDIAEQVAGKRLELLKEAFPHLTRVGHLSAAQNCPPCAADLSAVEAAARLVGVRIHPLPVQGPEELEQAFRAARDARTEALIVVGHGFLLSHRERIIKLVDTIRVPVMYTNATVVESGGLMSYADDPLDRARRAATFVAKIFQGAKPADLPVERPTKFELVINLQTAKAFGLTMPPALLLQADKVIP